MSRLRNWLVLRSRDVVIRVHPLDVDAETRPSKRSEINKTYWSTVGFGEAVTSGKQPLFDVAGGNAAALLPLTIARLQRTAEACSVKIRQSREAIEDAERAIAGHLEAGDFEAVTAAALRAKGHQAGLLAFTNDLQATQAALAVARTEAAAAVAALAAPLDPASRVRPIVLSSSAVKAAQCIFVPSSQFCAQQLSANPTATAEELCRLLRDAAVAWLAPFRPVAGATARENMLQLLDSIERFYALERLRPWDRLDWSCTCPYFFKNYVCKHMLRLAIEEGTWAMPTRFSKPGALAASTRGRKRHVGPALVRDPAAQHE